MLLSNLIPILPVIFYYFGSVYLFNIEQNSTFLDRNNTDSINIINKINRSIELSNTLETVEASLIASKNISIVSKEKTIISPKERTRLIRMVHKVVELANEVLDLNYTITRNKDDFRQRMNNGKSMNNSIVGDIIPINLFTPCGPDEMNAIQNSDEHQNADHIYSIEDNMVKDYDWETGQSGRMAQTRAQFDEKFKLGFDLLQEMIHRSNYLKGLVNDMIRKNLMKDCLKLDVPNIFQLPKPPHDNITKTLTTIYQSLANQTAHLYFIWEYQRNHFNRTGGCITHRRVELTIPIHKQTDRSKIYSPEGLDWFPRINRKNLQRIIANDFLVVSNNLRSLLCYLSQTISLFDLPVPTKQIIQQVLSHRIRLNVSCIRRSIFECQIMRDAARFFSDIEEFLRKESHRFFLVSKKFAN